jgi:hypothetical protein
MLGKIAEQQRIYLADGTLDIDLGSSLRRLDQSRTAQ